MKLKPIATHPSYRKRRGFTLMEIMIVTAIIAILAAVAYPTYVEQIRRTRRADATARLTELAQFMERNYTEALRYDLTNAGVAITLPFTKSPKEGTQAYYTLQLNPDPPGRNTFTLEAVPVATSDQANDKCKTLTLDNRGVKGTNSGLPVNDCWL